jgi:replication factor C large subunit
VAFVTGSGESTNKVESIVEDAQERREEQLEAHAGDAFAVRATESDSSEDGSVPHEDEPTVTDDETTTDGPESNANEDGSAAPDDAGDDGQSGLSDFV